MAVGESWMGKLSSKNQIWSDRRNFQSKLYKHHDFYKKHEFLAFTKKHFRCEKRRHFVFFFPLAKVIWGVSSPQRSPGAPIAPQVQMILFADVIEGFHEWNIDKCCRFHINSWHLWLWQFRSLEEFGPGILESNLLKFTTSLRCWLFLFCSLCLSTPRCSQCWWNHRGSSSFLLELEEQRASVANCFS